MRKIVVRTFAVCALICVNVAMADIVAVGKSEVKGLSGGKLGERFIYKVNGTMVAVRPGDLIDGCLVDLQGGLQCIADSKKDFIGSLQSFSELEDQLNVKDAQIESVLQEAGDLREQLSMLEEQVKAQDQVIISKEADIRELQFNVTSVNTLFESSQEKVKSLSPLVQDLQGRLSTLKAENDASVRVEALLTRNLQVAEAAAADHKIEIDRASRQLDELSQEMLTLSQEKDDLAATVAAKESDLQQTQNSILALEAKLVASQEQVALLGPVIVGLEQTVLSLEAQASGFAQSEIRLEQTLMQSEKVNKRNAYLEDTISKLRVLAEDQTREIAKYKRAVVVKGWNLR